MGYELALVNGGVPDVVNETAAALDEINNSYNNMYSSINRINDMNSSMFNGVISVNFGGIHNNYQDIIDEQTEVNEKVNDGTKAVEKVCGGIKKVVKSLAESKILASGFSSAISYSENILNMQNSISAVNDGSQSDSELQNKIYSASINSRTDMSTTMAAVGGLSSVGFSNDEAVQYTENLNKMFAVSNISGDMQAEATNALVASLSDGVVSGEELNSVLSITPEIVVGMADNMGLNAEQLSLIAEQGQLTADMMKTSMLGATDSISAEFANTKADWSDTMTNIGNMATLAFEPLGDKINEILNSPSFATFMTNLGNGMAVFANALSGVLDVISTVGGFITDNWSIAQPILVTILSILGYIYVATVLVGKVQKIAETATKAWEAASIAFNAVWSVCPIVIIILAIIAALYIVVGIINQVCGTSYSATGIILGVIKTAVAVVWNLFLALGDFILGIINGLINPFIAIANFIANIFTSPVSSIIYLFRDMAVTVLSQIKTVASAMDKVFGTSMADTVEGWIGSVNDLADKAVEKFAADENYEQKYESFNLSMESLGLSRMGYEDSYNSGYETGAGFADSFSMSDVGGGLGSLTGGVDTEGVDYSSMFAGSGLTESNMNSVIENENNTAQYSYDTAEYCYDTAANTGSIISNTDYIGECADGYGEELVSVGRSILDLMQKNMENNSNFNSNVTVDMRYMTNNVKSEEDADNLIQRIRNEIESGMNTKPDGASVFAGVVG